MDAEQQRHNPLRPDGKHRRWWWPTLSCSGHRLQRHRDTEQAGLWQLLGTGLGEKDKRVPTWMHRGVHVKHKRLWGWAPCVPGGPPPLCGCLWYVPQPATSRGKAHSRGMLNGPSLWEDMFNMNHWWPPPPPPHTPTSPNLIPSS